jgi:hypothetical protein
MTTHENSRSRPGWAKSLLNGQSLVKKWHVADPKMIFVKNQELLLLALMCKPTPVSAKSAGDCAKSKIYLWRLSQRNESWYAYPKWSIIYVECCASFQFCVSVAASQKKPDLGTLKMEKTLFMARIQNRSPWRSLPSQGPHACPSWPPSDKLCHD